MSELEVGDEWMLDNVAQRVLSVHAAGSKVALRLKALLERNETRLRKLLGICSRIEFVEQLRYQAKIETGWSARKEAAAEYQMSRLCVYLLSTCIDIAAREALAGGGHKGFREFIETLPGWSKEWLTDIYFLMRDHDYLEPENWLELMEDAKWHRKSTQWKCVEIADYLNDVRNKYTHYIDHQPPRLQHPLIQGKKYSIGTIIEWTDTGETTIWTVGVDSRLPEIELLRLVLVLHLRIHWLQTDDDEPVLNILLQRLRYRLLAHQFLKEVRFNVEAAKKWSTSQFLDVPRTARSPDMQPLPIDAAKAFIKMHETRFPTRNISFPKGPESYVSAIETINDRIRDFVNDHRRRVESGPKYWWGEKGNVTRWFLSELSTSPEVRAVVVASIDIVRDLETAIEKGMY